MTKEYVVLVDGDIVAYQAASATDGRTYTLSNGEKFKYKKEADKRAEETDCTVVLDYFPEPLDHAIYIVKNKIRSISANLRGLGIDPIEEKLYLSGKGSFRESDVNPMYKSNRNGIRRPSNLKGCKEYLEKEGAIHRYGEYEADDLIIMEANRLWKDGKVPIIASLDKDLGQFPCLFYNFSKKTLVSVSELDGMRSFYRQLLTGDATDGIIGLKGVGPKTASKIVDHHVEEFPMYCAVLEEWSKRLERHPDEDELLFVQRLLATVRMTGQLLWLSREEGDRWKAPEDTGVILKED